MGSAPDREVGLLEQAWPDAHADLVRALVDPSSYPGAVQEIGHIETHISDVFLTGDYAYKLKKPLNLGFLDFSTLERRRACCEEELRLNRRLAPELYLAVVPITGTASRPRVSGQGEPIEYAVQMRQFDQAGMLERVLARGELTSGQMDEIAEMVARFHALLPAATSDSPFGTPDSITAPALQNFEQLATLLDSDPDLASLERLRGWTQAQHEILAPLFLRRQRDGFVRECHGDLHLGNLVLVDSRVRIFDCIEFNPALRWIDLMNEAAFLAMDLTQRRHSELAFRFLNRYLEITGDYAGVRLLRYYMVYRALVRAKVAALRAAQDNVDLSLARALRAKWRAHLTLSEQLAQAAGSAVLVLHGLSGSGKTQVSRTILEAIGAIRIRSDIERKRLYGLGGNARSDSALGGDLYSAQASTATYARLAELAGAIVQAGFPALVDGTFLKHSQREQFRGLARRYAVPFAILHMEATEATLRERIAQRAATGVDASEATAAVLDWQLQTQEPLTVAERAQVWDFDTEHMGERETAKQARQMLRHLAPPELG